MKLRSTLLCSFVALSALSSPLLAAATGAPAPVQEETTELGEKMGAMSKAFKKLRQQIGDPAKNSESLQLVATIRENAEASLKYVPEKTGDLPAADQTAFKANYLKSLKSLLAEIDKLEVALKAGNNEEAKSQLEVMGNAQKEGHKEFKKKKPEKK